MMPTVYWALSALPSDADQLHVAVAVFVSDCEINARLAVQSRAFAESRFTNFTVAVLMSPAKAS